jgi:hypothetical protein
VDAVGHAHAPAPRVGGDDAVEAGERKEQVGAARE